MRKALTIQEVWDAWDAGRERLLKGETSSPGLPVAPRAPHFRAPRPKRAFFDPVEQASHPGTPEIVQPMTLGDLKQLEQNAPVEKIPQRATGVKSAPRPASGLRVATTTSDEARRSAVLRETQSSHKYTGVLHQIGKRLARKWGTRPVQNVPRHFMPV
jgi:hypothetical protein